MKNLLRIVLPVIIACLVFSSCKHGSIMKRKYMRGYYVSHKHNTGDVKAQTQLSTVTKTVAEVPQVEYVNPIEQPEVSFNPGSDLVSVIDKKKAKKVVSEEPAVKKQSLPKTVIQKFYRLSPLKANAAAISKGPEAGIIGAALSLFWIVILVILLLYLIGLAADGFGLGWAIHILALIILVLLILWLLRIL